MDEIQHIKPRLFKSLVKRKVQKKAFKDLILKKNGGQKGSQILYEKHSLAPYLTSKSNMLTNDKLEMFAYRCEMNNLPFNYRNKTIFEMGCHEQILNNEHLLNGPTLNGNIVKLNLKEILNGSNKEKNNVLQKLQENTKRRIEHLRDSAL